MQLTRHQYAEIWEIGRSCWILSRGNRQRAMELAKERVDEKYGSVIAALQLIAIVMQILYLLFKFWSDSHVSLPSRSMNDEVLRMLLASGYTVEE